MWMADFGGRYRRVRLLGSGGMGEVWLALDERLDRPVAIKIMHSQMLANPQDAARFQREMRLAARMQHPNIMTVFTTETDHGVPFMVMEYLQGTDLSKAPPDRNAARAARIGRDACAALAYAHAQGVVHRDIKPGNLFLCDTGQVKVTDFGIAKAVSGTSLSATGTLVGTLQYMAPEQWLGEPAAFSNDIWAVGCVLYELLTGRPPRTYDTPTEYVAAAARREGVRPIAPIATVAPWLADAVMAMLRPDPRDRPTAADCVELLTEGTASRGTMPHPAPDRQPLPAPRAATLPEPFTVRSGPSARSSPGRRIALTAVALALLAAAGGTTYAIAKGMDGGGRHTALGPGGSGDASPGGRGESTPPPGSPASDIWIAQLGSIAVSKGPAALRLELKQIRADIPDAQYVVSADYASLKPGYWVVYYAGSFTNGNEALAYCAAHGRTTSNQWYGRYLSHDVKDRFYICLPPGGPRKALCYRP